MKLLKKLKGTRMTTPVIVLLNIACCGIMMTSTVMVILSSLVGQVCQVTWAVEPQPAGLTLSVKIECPSLMQWRPINRLYLNPVDRKW